TFITSSGTLRAMALDSAANLWKETSPANFSLIQSVADAIINGNVPYANSTTLFGREFIALSDGTNGTGLPRQYDDTNLDRVSQSGPGAPPSVADEHITTTITASANGLQPAGSIVGIVASPSGFVCNRNIVTCTFVGPVLDTFWKGKANVLIVGATNSSYNGTWPIL